MTYTDPTRDDCQLGNKRVTYAKLQQDYRCNECGGRIVVRPIISANNGWYPACGRCSSKDFIHECELDRQKAQAVEVSDGMPAELMAQLTQKGEV